MLSTQEGQQDPGSVTCRLRGQERTGQVLILQASTPPSHLHSLQGEEGSVLTSPSPRLTPPSSHLVLRQTGQQ